MAEITREQIMHDGAIDYLIRGCQRVLGSEVRDSEILPVKSPVFYTTQTHRHDLARFSGEIADAYSGVNRDKLTAGFCAGIYIVRHSDVSIDDFRLKTESMTTPDIPLTDRVNVFDSLANYDAIEDLYDFYPLPENSKLDGKNYHMGVRAMLATGYFVLTDTVDAMNAEEARIWFTEAYGFYNDKNSQPVIEDFN